MKSLFKYMLILSMGLTSAAYAGRVTIINNSSVPILFRNSTAQSYGNNAIIQAGSTYSYNVFQAGFTCNIDHIAGSSLAVGMSSHPLPATFTSKTITVSDSGIAYRTGNRSGFNIVNNSANSVIFKRGSNTILATIPAGTQSLIALPADMPNSAGANLCASDGTVLKSTSKSRLEAYSQTWTVPSSGAVVSTTGNHVIIWNTLPSQISVSRVQNGSTTSTLLATNTAAVVSTSSDSSFTLLNATGTEIPILAGNESIPAAANKNIAVIQQALAVSVVNVD